MGLRKRRIGEVDEKVQAADQAARNAHGEASKAANAANAASHKIDAIDKASRRLVLDVVENLETREIEVQDREGRWYALRVRPYKTAEKRIEGAVLVLIDITHLKKQR